MTQSYRITLTYTVTENFDIQADSLLKAEETAVLLANSRLESHYETSDQADYEIIDAEGESLQGSVVG